MLRTGWIARGLLACGAFALGCGDASRDGVTDEAAAVHARDAAPSCVDGGSAPPDISDAANPAEALEAYARSRTGTCLTVQGTRRGVPFEIEYQIK
jgi:hypothetical protein